MNKSNDGYIVEFYHVGNSVKVTAVDPASGTEASVIVPTTLPSEQASVQAIRKLEFVLNKKS